jgi:hypothetical protein
VTGPHHLCPPAIENMVSTGGMIMRISFERKIKFLTITKGTKTRKPRNGKVKIYTKGEIAELMKNQ